jgi:integral membrane protein
MILIKLASILLLVLTLALAIIISRFFKLKKKGINFADLAFPFLIFEYYLITGKVFSHNSLPILGIVLSLLAIILVFYFLNTKRSFYYPKFIKFFWRAGFLLTLLIYIIMIVQVFMMK